MRIHLPKGLRLELVDNDNYTIPVGSRMTIVGEREYADTKNIALSNVWVVLDKDWDSGLSFYIEFSKCKIITDNFNEQFNPSKEDKQ